MKPGQVKAGELTAGVKRQYLGCVGKVANGINTVHLAYVREGTGHALIGAREWIPAEHLKDPAASAVMGLPADLVFRTKGQLAIDSLAEALAAGWTSCAAMRCTARAPSCASTWKTTTRPTCCGFRPASASPWPAGSR
jgi:SRSO17 transposase